MPKITAAGVINWALVIEQLVHTGVVTVPEVAKALRSLLEGGTDEEHAAEDAQTGLETHAICAQIIADAMK